MDDADATALLFAPGKDPEHVPADRAMVDHTASLAWDEEARYYITSLSTAGYAAGDWTCQAVVTGGADDVDSWAYLRFRVKA